MENLKSCLTCLHYEGIMKCMGETCRCTCSFYREDEKAKQEVLSLISSYLDKILGINKLYEV